MKLGVYQSIFSYLAQYYDDNQIREALNKWLNDWLDEWLKERKRE